MEIRVCFFPLVGAKQSIFGDGKEERVYVQMKYVVIIKISPEY